MQAQNKMENPKPAGLKWVKGFSIMETIENEQNGKRIPWTKHMKESQ